MGRRKIDIRYIEDERNRQVTFTKRRNGLLKKARELSILCGAEIAVVIFSSVNGQTRLHDYCSKDIAKTLSRLAHFEGTVESRDNNTYNSQVTPQTQSRTPHNPRCQLSHISADAADATLRRQRIHAQQHQPHHQSYDMDNDDDDDDEDDDNINPNCNDNSLKDVPSSSNHLNLNGHAKHTSAINNTNASLTSTWLPPKSQPPTNSLLISNLNNQHLLQQQHHQQQQQSTLIKKEPRPTKIEVVSISDIHRRSRFPQLTIRVPHSNTNNIHNVNNSFNNNNNNSNNNNNKTDKLRPQPLEPHAQPPANTPQPSPRPFSTNARPRPITPREALPSPKEMYDKLTLAIEQNQHQTNTSTPLAASLTKSMSLTKQQSQSQQPPNKKPRMARQPFPNLRIEIPNKPKTTTSTSPQNSARKPPPSSNTNNNEVLPCGSAINVIQSGSWTPFGSQYTPTHMSSIACALPTSTSEALPTMIQTPHGDLTDPLVTPKTSNALSSHPTTTSGFIPLPSPNTNNNLGPPSSNNNNSNSNNNNNNNNNNSNNNSTNNSNNSVKNLSSTTPNATTGSLPSTTPTNTTTNHNSNITNNNNNNNSNNNINTTS